MSLLTILRRVCLAVGVAPPTGNLFDPNDRTKQELLTLANQQARLVALETYDWPELQIRHEVTYGDNPARFLPLPLPGDFHRLLRRGNIYSSLNAQRPLEHVPDPDDWHRYKLNNDFFTPGPPGRWSFTATYPTVPLPTSGSAYGTAKGIDISPVRDIGETISFMYLSNRPVLRPVTGGAAFERTESFTTADDRVVFDDDLLALSMIWQWKAYKGAPYAEDLETYEETLAGRMGRATPSGLLVPAGARNRHSYGADVVLPPGMVP